MKNLHLSPVCKRLAVMEQGGPLTGGSFKVGGGGGGWGETTAENVFSVPASWISLADRTARQPPQQTAAHGRGW